MRSLARLTREAGHAARALFRAFGLQQGVYDQDGLRTIHNADFMQEPAFRKAYARGVQAAADYRWHWRIHVGLWVADAASRLDGDFVECGVNRGFMSSAIMEYLNWDRLGKTFYLLDAFDGFEAGPSDGGLRQVDPAFYVRGSERVRANFAEWTRVRLIEGRVPDTLPRIDASSVAYLHLDMNSAAPEAAALDFLWARIVPGGFVLMDDHSYRGYEAQKHALDRVAQARDVKILSLPTGQGLLVKPASESGQTKP